MKHPDHETDVNYELPAAPLTLEGSALLHQIFRLRRAEWNRLDSRQRAVLTEEASSYFAADRDDGHTAIFSELGHKGDLIIVHVRPAFDNLDAAQIEVARLGLSEFLEPSYSYVSVVEIGLYEASVRLYQDLIDRGLKPHSPEWNTAVAAALSEQRVKLGARLTPSIP